MYDICYTTGKRSFYDEHDAERALGRARSRRQRQGDARGSRRGFRTESRYYYCEDCDGYHLTAQSRREYQRAAA